MLIACKEREEIEDLKRILNSEFDIKSFGIAKKIFELEIEKKKEYVVLCFCHRRNI